MKIRFLPSALSCPELQFLTTFVINDTYDVVQAAGSIPANLANPLVTVWGPNNLAPGFVVGDTTISFAKDIAAASLPSRFDDYDINNTGVALANFDFITRVNATSGSDVIDASLSFGGFAGAPVVTFGGLFEGYQVHVVYTEAAQSQAGSFDQIAYFTSGEDKIDLSFLKLPRYESSKAGNGVNFDTNGNQIVDALEGNAIRSLGAAPIFAINASAANLFIDAGTYKPIATQTLVDGNFFPSTTLFIDADGNGNYDPSLDMAVVLVGVNNVVTGDFIFNQYGGGWGG